jgi:predicted enzyme related to lactoylglutathione lyase
MAIFVDAEGNSAGSLVFGENYQPSHTGAVVYLSASEDLTIHLDKIVQHGGQVLLPKTAIHDGEHGYIALFLDSEGNRVGLYAAP